MRKYSCQIIYIILCLLAEQSECSTIKGNVSDLRTGNPVSGAFIMIDDIKKTYFTDNNGDFIIEDLLPGKYLLKISEIFRSHKESVIIKEVNETIVLSIKLKSPIIDLDSVSTPKLKSYHEKIRKFNLIKPVLGIQIDTLILLENYLYVQPAVKNYSTDSIYLFKDYNCFNVIKPIVVDKSGKIIKRNMFLIDCVGEKTCPDSTDLILIEPESSIKYPLTKLKLFNFNSLPNGEYSIKIKYEFEEPTEINANFCRGKSVINSLIKGLRGTYFSNFLTFRNG